MSENDDRPPIGFAGQVVAVTGAGRGLGAAYARLLGSLGAAVIVHDAGVDKEGTGLDPSVAEAVAQQIREDGGMAAACHGNLEQPAECRRVVEFAVERFGRLDALIHNAGLVIFAAIEEIEPRLWERMVNLGVHAPFHLLQAAIPQMRRQGYGRIVLTTSGRAFRIADCVPGLAGYTVGKMAQLGLMVGIAAELDGTNIHINAIAPVAATRILRRHDPQLLPELVAPGAAFLASSACDFSGLILRAAGGRFSVAEWSGSRGIDLGPTPVSPDRIAARWRDILETA
jgi:NAD(P)-dependent dehydrogenase (short-subunit alcohol dehydrogenase family)